jgi:hypothetical protein
LKQAIINNQYQLISEEELARNGQTQWRTFFERFSRPASTFSELRAYVFCHLSRAGRLRPLKAEAVGVRGGVLCHYRKKSNMLLENACRRRLVVNQIMLHQYARAVMEMAGLHI